MLRTIAFALALASLLTYVAPLLLGASAAQAGCTRVYTQMGWQTRCS